MSDGASVICTLIGAMAPKGKKGLIHWRCVWSTEIHAHTSLDIFCLLQDTAANNFTSPKLILPHKLLAQTIFNHKNDKTQLFT